MFLLQAELPSHRSRGRGAPAPVRRLAPLLAAVVCCAVLGCSQGSTPADAEGGLELTPCQLAAPGLTARLAAQCGTLAVAEDATAADGRQVELRIAVLPAVRRDAAPEPLFFLAGGPGQAATESYLQLAPALRRVREERDIVLVDQRGTGGSGPLDCTPEEDQVDDLLAGFDLELLAGMAEECAREASETADPRRYRTLEAVADLDQVREALGYERINLYGVSYGTRVALSYLRAHPDQVRAVVLDGVVPQDLSLGPDVARDAQRALELIFARCAADEGCAERYPELEQRFGRLLASLEAGPREVTLDHPTTGEELELRFDRDSLAGAVRLLSYAPETAALLPLLIFEAEATGDLRRLAAQAVMVGGQLGASMSQGMGLSVLCAEDAPFFSVDVLSDEELAGKVAGTFLGDAQVQYLRRICQVWPHEPVDASFKEPVTSSVPVLLLSGEADPVTPPSYGDQAAATLSASLHIVAPGQGHNVLGRGCLPKVVGSFLTAGSVEGLEADCVDELRAAPFFVNPSGPSP